MAIRAEIAGRRPGGAPRGEAGLRRGAAAASTGRLEKMAAVLQGRAGQNRELAKGGALFWGSRARIPKGDQEPQRPRQQNAVRPRPCAQNGGAQGQAPDSMRRSTKGPVAWTEPI